jgi:hypothetical protein
MFEEIERYSNSTKKKINNLLSFIRRGFKRDGSNRNKKKLNREALCTGRTIGFSSISTVATVAGCRGLTDDVQARLALSFANCFLAKSGLKTYPCGQGSAISDCLKAIDNNAFTAYSNFFTVSNDEEAKFYLKSTCNTHKKRNRKPRKVYTEKTFML